MSALSRQTHPAPFLPEKVLQFGTGVLLRGLPDFLINKANKEGVFNGSIVVVKSTDSATDVFTQQDNRYTVVVQGTQQGQDINEATVVTAISRVLAAQTQWAEILTIARNPNLQVIISNTTEVGLQYLEESIFQSPPQSFPGKLTAFLYERFRNVGGSKNKGMVVIPTELIIDNGLKLRDTVERLATYNELGKLFTKWLKYHVRFCNSLVDRIVTAGDDATKADLGYTDELLTVTEPYHLWAIEGDDRVRQMLSFADVNSSVIIDEDVTFYRERKIRVLNGSHTFTVPLAYLLGLETVYAMSQDALMGPLIERLMDDELVPTVPVDGMGESGLEAVRQFAREVRNRFANPHMEHLLLKITLQETAKMQARNVVTLQRYYAQFGTVPRAMALSFAGYLLFMKAVRAEGQSFFGEVAVGSGFLTYPINDDKAGYFFERWQGVDAQKPDSIRQFVATICADLTLWNTDLSALPQFVDTVAKNLNDLLTLGVAATLRQQVILTAVDDVSKPS